MSRARPLLALFFAVVAACAPAAGASGPYGVRIARVHHRQVDGEVVDARGLTPGLDGSLDGLHHLAPAGPSHRRAELGAELWLHEQMNGEGGRDLFLQAQVEVPPRLRGLLGAVVHASVLLERSGGEGAFEEDARTAAERAFIVLDTRFALAEADPEAVRRLLQAEDPELVILALEWIRENAPRDFAAEVVPLLGHGDERVAALAIECLGYSGDPGYAAVIIRNAQPMRRGPMREVYRSLARLRGADALGFLRFAAANEDENSLREEAERALRLALTGIVADPTPGLQPAKQRLARGHRQ